MSLIWPISRRDIGIISISLGWYQDILLQLLEISKIQFDNFLVVSFRLIRKIFVILLNISIRLSNYNN